MTASRILFAEEPAPMRRLVHGRLEVGVPATAAAAGEPRAWPTTADAQSPFDVVVHDLGTGIASLQMAFEFDAPQNAVREPGGRTA